MTKNLLISTSFLIISLLFINATAKAPTPTNNVNIQVNKTKLTRASIEAQIGRKFNFKERVVWLLLKQKLNPEIKKDTKGAYTAKAISIIGASVFIGLFTSLALGLLILVLGFFLIKQKKEIVDEKIVNYNEYEKDDENKPENSTNGKSNEKTINSPKEDTETKLEKKRKTEKINSIAIFIGLTILGIVLGLIFIGFLFSLMLKILLGIQ